MKKNKNTKTETVVFSEDIPKNTKQTIRRLMETLKYAKQAAHHRRYISTA